MDNWAIQTGLRVCHAARKLGAEGFYSEHCRNAFAVKELLTADPDSMGAVWSFLVSQANNGLQPIRNIGYGAWIVLGVLVPPFLSGMLRGPRPHR